MLSLNVRVKFLDGNWAVFVDQRFFALAEFHYFSVKKYDFPVGTGLFSFRWKALISRRLAALKLRVSDKRLGL